MDSAKSIASLTATELRSPQSGSSRFPIVRSSVGPGIACVADGSRARREAPSQEAIVPERPGGGISSPLLSAQSDRPAAVARTSARVALRKREPSRRQRKSSRAEPRPPRLGSGRNSSAASEAPTVAPPSPVMKGGRWPLAERRGVEAEQARRSAAALATASPDRAPAAVAPPRRRGGPGPGRLLQPPANAAVLRRRRRCWCSSVREAGDSASSRSGQCPPVVRTAQPANRSRRRPLQSGAGSRSASSGNSATPIP